MKIQGYYLWKLLSMLTLLLIAPCAFSQQADEEVLEESEVMPQFPGETTEMMKYLRIPVPDQTSDGHGITGRVIMQCVIEKDGKVTNSKVVRSVDPYLDKVALKLVANMPQWIPGEQDGNKVRVGTSGSFSECYKMEWRQSVGWWYLAIWRGSL